MPLWLAILLIITAFCVGPFFWGSVRRWFFGDIG